MLSGRACPARAWHSLTLSEIRIRAELQLVGTTAVARARPAFISREKRASYPQPRRRPS